MDFSFKLAEIKLDWFLNTRQKYIREQPFYIGTAFNVDAIRMYNWRAVISLFNLIRLYLPVPEQDSRNETKLDTMRIYF